MDKLNVKDSVKIFVQKPADTSPVEVVNTVNPCDECGIRKSCNEETRKRCCVRCAYDNLNADCDSCILRMD